MADVVATYTLSTPGGTIIFNNGTLGDGTDKYWLQPAPIGLDGPTLRTPSDPVSFGHGGRAYTTWKGPRLITIQGVYLIESSFSQADCQILRNGLHFPLAAALESILSPTSGTLSYTPDGQGAESWTVFYWATLDAPYNDNYTAQNFSFGLFSEAADPA